MSRAQFHLAYDGPALRAGSMDVNELAPALLSVGDLLREINQQVNGKEAEVAVRVKADFQRGSFDVSLLLDQSLIEHAKNLFSGTPLTDAKKILELAFGTGIATAGTVGVLNSVLDLWKKLKGERPKSTVRDESRHITIIQMGNDSHVNAESISAALYENDKIRASISGTTKPVSSSGIKSLEIRRGKKIIDKVTKDDLPVVDASQAVTVVEQPGIRRLTDTREAMLRVTRANFEKGKWGFSDGTATFSADIADEQFKRKLDAREIGFYKGDILLVLLATTQTVSQGGAFETRYVIERVLDHIHAPIQQEIPAVRELSTHDQKRLPPSQG